MLPDPHSSEFPAALKAAREAQGMSRAELARRSKIHGVMPRRYEEPACTEFSRPVRNTWEALNRALGFEIEGETGIVEDGDLLLQEASIEEIVAELASRNFTVTLSFSANGAS